MSAAQVLGPLLTQVLGSEVALRLRCWDGSTHGPEDAPVRLVVRHRRALRRLLWAPGELGVARAYVSGDLDVEGSLFEALEALDGAGDTPRGLRISGSRRELLSAATRLGALGPPVRPPREEAPPSRRRHSRDSDAAAIAHHYDVGNDFYRLVLGDSMLYSCAYFTDPANTLDQAQADKIRLILDKLDVQPGMRLLDIGCGWGSLVLQAAQERGVEAVGVTLSRAQCDYARARVAEAGLQGQVQVRLQDYRDIADGPFEAIASIGMAEHVGAAMLPTYAAALHTLLTPGGRVLNHAIATRPERAGRFSADSFIDRYVFPDGELLPVGTTVAGLEEAGLEVRDVHALREHYGLTLRRWVANLEQHWEEAVALVGQGRARVWRLYMAASALSFEHQRIGVNQVLAVRPDPAGRSGIPLVRPT